MSKLPPSLTKNQVSFHRIVNWLCLSLRVSLVVDDCWVSLWLQSDLLDVSLQAVVQLMQTQVAREVGWTPDRSAVTRVRAATAAAGVPGCLAAGCGGLLVMVLRMVSLS